MFRQKKSIFERLTGIINNPGEEERELSVTHKNNSKESDDEDEGWTEESSDGQLTIDVYQTPTEIVLQTIVAGVKPEDLEITINREMVTVRGKREQTKTVGDDNYFFQELYWGSFSRSVVLPEEIDVEEAEATEQHGLLTIRLPKIDKKKTQKLKVRAG